MRGLRGIRSFRTVVFLCFFISGLAGLVLEVVWARMLGVTFGNTVFAAGTVLSAFMLGLALGSAWFGRLVDRFEKPFMLYGLLEIGIGIYALLFPLLAWLVTLIYQWFFRAFDPGFFLLSAVRFIFSLLLIVPPATLMGGTLPVLSRFLGTKDEEPRREIGYLYAMNTTGAVAGCFLAGFYFLEWFGVRGSLYVAGGFALTVGALAYGFGRQVKEYTPALTADVVSTPKAEKKRRSKKREKKKTSPPAPQPALTEQYNEQTFRLVLIVFGIAGFCSLAYEVLWTRMLIFVMSTSLYAFSTMLTVFLSGIALGSYFCSRFFVHRVRSPLFWFGAIEILVGLAALFSSYVLSKPVTINSAVIKQWAP
ncbi:MFS transporter, partial [bacterium]|nr:MFS transporter [bacterium]